MNTYTCIAFHAAVFFAVATVQVPAADTETKIAVLAEKGVPGGAVIASRKVVASVIDIAKDTRKVTLGTSGGARSIYTAGPEVANFDQLKVGDQVRFMVVEALAVSLRKGNAPVTNRVAAGLGLAPLGDKPGLLVGDAMEVHSTVKALDSEARTATLEMQDGTTRVVNVRKDVDMAQAAIGDQVTITLVEALAVTVEAP